MQRHQNSGIRRHRKFLRAFQSEQGGDLRRGDIFLCRLSDGAELLRIREEDLAFQKPLLDIISCPEIRLQRSYARA